MKIFKHARIASTMVLILAAVCNCQKPDDGQEGTKSEPKNNYFTYDGYSFDINSVVKYEQGDNTVELWLSPMAGATTISEIESEGDYVVLKTNKAYLGKRDRFTEGTSKNSSISFGSSHKFAYGDAGTAYIQASIEGDEVNLEFLAQNLYTKAEINATLQGSYKGRFTTQTEQPYENEWGINRNRETLSNAVYTTFEEGGNSELSLTNESGNECVKISIAPSLIGKSINFPYSGSSSNLKIAYNGAVEFNLAKATGTFTTSFDNGEVTVNLDATNGEKRIRAIYKGSYEDNIVKLNRYIFNYQGTSLVGSGTYEIVKLMVENTGSICKFFLSPSTGYDITGSNSTHMPILTVPSSIINNGKKKFTELTDWKFEFVEMQVWPYEDEYRPHPAATDWIEVSKNGNTYKIEFVLSGIATGMPSCHIDAHYKGEAK